MKSNNDIKVDIDGYLLEEHFMNEFNLSNILLKRYSHLLSQHLKKPETKDLHNWWSANGYSWDNYVLYVIQLRWIIDSG